MDPYWFDEWTKALAAGTSRRAFLVGVLKAGAAAIGLAGAASAQTALADDDDDDDDEAPKPPLSGEECFRRLDRCIERSSFKKCSRCIDELYAAGCPFPVVPPDSGLPSFTQQTCGCASDAYCADGNGCTLDICSSNVCYNPPIGNQLSDCRQCRSNRQCPNGGKCCKGRCCPAGTRCRTNDEGIGICCAKCTNGQTCCQTITAAGNPNDSRDYVLALATCVGQEGAAAGLPTFCCGGCSGRYTSPSDPNSGLECFCPRNSLP